MDVVSPELVLVDPVLAAEARRLLPDPPDCLAPRPREARSRVEAREPRTPWASVPLVLSITSGAATQPLVTESGGANAAAGWAPLVTASTVHAPLQSLPSVTAPTPRADERARPSILAVIGVLLVALVVGSPALDLIPGGSDAPSFARTDEETPDVTPPSTDTGSSPAESATVVLRWPAVPGADLYDVVLWKDGRRVMDLRLTTNQLEVRDGVIPDGRRLEDGQYQWFAFAGFREKDTTRLGRMLVNGEFGVDAPDVSP